MPDNKFSELFAARDKNKDSASVSGADEESGNESHTETDAGSLPPPSNSTTADPSEQSPSGQTISSGRRSSNQSVRSEQIAHKRAPGRPPGKRSNPDYEQATIYIRRDTHRAVKVALLQQEDGRQFSELVEDLLQKWVNP